MPDTPSAPLLMPMMRFCVWRLYHGAIRLAMCAMGLAVVKSDANCGAFQACMRPNTTPVWDAPLLSLAVMSVWPS